MALGSDVMDVALEGYALLKVSSRQQGLDGLRAELATRWVKPLRAEVEPSASTAALRGGRFFCDHFGLEGFRGLCEYFWSLPEGIRGLLATASRKRSRVHFHDRGIWLNLSDKLNRGRGTRGKQENGVRFLFGCWDGQHRGRAVSPRGPGRGVEAGAENQVSPMFLKCCVGALVFEMAAAVAGCASSPESSAVAAADTSAGQESIRRTSRGAVRTTQAARPVVPGFEYAYEPPDSADLQPIYTQVREADLWRQLPEVQAIDGMFVLPRPLRLVIAECGGAGALYRPAGTEVVLCYETLRALYERGQEQQRALGLADGYPLRYVRASMRFMVLHEIGHALVDLLDLPVTGRQEDAVDQLATILMLRFASGDETPDEVIDNMRLAANWLLSNSTGAYDLHAYADVHALGEQRYFNLQCMIYGTDPAGFADMVAAMDLTPERATGCEREMRQVVRAWLRLLLPHLAPGNEMYEEEAKRYLGWEG